MSKLFQYNGIKWIEIAKDGIEIEPQEIVNKLETLKEPLAMSLIKGLKEQLRILNRNIKEKRVAGGGMGNIITEAFSGDGSTTSFTLSRNVANAGKAILVFYQGQALEATTHYSVSGKTLTLTAAPVDGTTIWVWFIRT